MTTAYHGGVRAIAAVIVVAGCGRVGFDALDDGVTTYRDAVLADAPTAYWRLDDTDTVARDQMGQVDGTYAGTCTHGAAGALAGDANTATTLDGATCNIVLDTRLEFAGTAPFTLEAWVAEEPGLQIAHLITRESRMGASPVNGYALLDFDGQGGAYLERVANSAITHSAAMMIPRSQFVYLAGTYDGADMVLYVDGVALPAMPDATPIPQFAATALLGREPSGFFFGGSLDEVAVYDHAVPADHIALHHHIGVAGPQ